MPARPDLETNPDFWADIRSPMPKKEVMEKWNCSSGYVVNRRKDAGGVIDIARTREPGEADEITDNGDGTRQFNFIRHRPVTLEDARELIRSSGDNPDAYNISIKTIAYGGDKSSNKISAWPKQGIALAETYPLAHLYEQARSISEAIVDTTITDRAERATVVCVADMQLGKTGRRGGTKETLARLENKRFMLDYVLADRQPTSVLIADLGDGIEGFESGGNPMFTNDLSLPDQLDAYATEILKFIQVAERHAPTEVGVVASNHAAWRKGKQNLGNPSDDFGIFVHRQVKKVTDAAGLDVRYHFPEEYDESLRIDMCGTPIGFVHGNQFAHGKAIDWWQAQAFGAQAVAQADVLVTGHYHTYGAGVAGINPATGNERMWLGCPTLDNGSDWFRQTAGRDSEPGLLIFDVTAEGLDLSSITIL